MASENLVSEKSIGYDFGKFGLKKKSRFRFPKIWYQKKSLGIGFAQNFGIVIQCVGGTRHSTPYMNQLRKSSNHKISSCQGGQRQSVWRPPISIWQTCISGHQHQQQGKATSSAPKKCSLRHNLAIVRSRVSLQEIRQARYSPWRRRSLFSNGENWSNLLRNSTMMSIVLVITHSEQGGKKRLTGIRLKNLDAYCLATMPCGAKKSAPGTNPTLRTIYSSLNQAFKSTV